MATPPVNVPVGPVAGEVKVTTTPLKGSEPASFTVACRAVANAVLIAALCGVPPVAVMEAGVPVKLVSENAAGVDTPLTVAFTVNGPPGVLFAVRAVAVATPLESVTICTLVALPGKVPLAPFPAAVTVKVTVTPGTTAPRLSFTVALRAVANAVFTAVLWGVPAVVTMLLTAIPVPLRFTVKVLGSESTIVRVPVRVPVADGLKMTFTVQLAPLAIEPVQEFVPRMKSLVGDGVTEVMETAAARPLFKTTDMGELCVPTS